MDNQKVWKKLLELAKPKISSGNFSAFFSKTNLEEIREEKIILSTPSAFIEQTLKVRHLSIIENGFKELLGKTYQIEFITKQKARSSTDDQPEEDIFQPIKTVSGTLLNPNYTLDNFVVGLTNNIAYAAAQAVSENPGRSYNPLFIYGGTGVGKTHLMVGIGNAILNKKPHLKVIYCSSEKFTNDYVEAIQNRKMGDLRKKYRSADLLLVDDVQFFSGREQTQEEFFHTFNELTAKNSQIVLTSDRSPMDMPKLEDRLKSRFQGGLMVDIQLPDFDTRVAILKAKCAEKNEYLPEECLSLIAESVQSNTRELEGKLIQIIQSLKIQKLEPTLANVQRYLGIKDTSNIQKLNSKQVLSGVCHYFNVKQTDLIGPKRQKELVLPRHMAMYILSEDLKLTVEKIGDIMGGRDHTTVMHGRDKIKKLISSDEDIKKNYTNIKQNLSTN